MKPQPAHLSGGGQLFMPGEGMALTGGGGGRGTARRGGRSCREPTLLLLQRQLKRTEFLRIRNNWDVTFI